jgi:protein gp37
MAALRGARANRGAEPRPEVTRSNGIGRPPRRVTGRGSAASLADILDNEVPQAWRDDLWQLWRETPNLRWIPLTKRIGNGAKSG